jgi:hypothetical protein
MAKNNSNYNPQKSNSNTIAPTPIRALAYACLGRGSATFGHY